MQIFLRSANAKTRDDEFGYQWLYPTPVVFGEPGDRIEVCVSLLQWFPVRRNLETDNEYIKFNPVDPGNSLWFAFWVQIDIPRGNYSANDIVSRITEAIKANSYQDDLEASFDTTNLRLVIKWKTTSGSHHMAITGDAAHPGDVWVCKR
jgi:hypothetical protein